MKKALKILYVAMMIAMPFMSNADAKTRVHFDFEPASVAIEDFNRNSMDNTRNREMNYDVNPMRNDAAIDAVASLLGINEEGCTSAGVKLNFTIEDALILKVSPNFSETCTVVKAFEDRGSHVVTYGRYAVGQFSGYIWEYDVVGDNWKTQMPLGAFKEDIFTQAYDRHAFAAFYDCSPFEAWASNPVEDVDMTVYGTGRDHWSTPGAEDMLIVAMADGVKVHYTSGYWDVDTNKFAPQSTMYTTNLANGQSVHVWYEGKEGMPNQAIVVETPRGRYVQALGYNGRGGKRDTIYVK